MHPVKMTVVARYIGAEGSKRPGDIVLVTEHRAQQLESNGVARREGAELKKPESPEAGAAKPAQLSPAAQVSPVTTPPPPPLEDGTSSASTTPTASASASVPSMPATGGGGTPTKRGRGRPPKARN